MHDAQYVSLAKQLGICCLSEDAPLQAKCPGLVRSMADYMKRDGGVSSANPGLAIGSAENDALKNERRSLIFQARGRRPESGRNQEVQSRRG